jgi:hypothetical protein
MSKYTRTTGRLQTTITQWTLNGQPVECALVNGQWFRAMGARRALLTPDLLNQRVCVVWEQTSTHGWRFIVGIERASRSSLDDWYSQSLTNP